MPRRHFRRRPGTLQASAAGGIALMLALAACGSGGGAKAGATTKPSTGASQPSSKSASPATPAAPGGLVVSTLLTADLLRSASLTATGIEDDGGASVSGEFISQVTAATTNSELTVVLTTFPDAAAASSAYQSSAGPSATPLPGAGEKAALNGQTVYVLKGSQVLSVQGKLSPAAEQKAVQQKERGGNIDPGIYQAAGTDAKTVATAVAAKLTGQSAGKNYVALPKGAINPCFDPAGLAALKLSGATEQNVPSENAPAQECDYALGSAGSLHVETLTSTQAKAAVPPTSLMQDFHQRTAAAQSGPANGNGAAGNADLFNHGTFIGRDIGAPGDFDVEVYLDPPVASTLEIFEEPSGSFTPEKKCEEVVRYTLDGWLKEQGVDPLAPGFAQDYNDAVQKLTKACQQATGR